MPPVYRHTNLVAKDWRKLARFYEEVFGCAPVLPERELSGDWLARGTGVPDAGISGIHLRLPGHGPDGPTLEVFQYTESLPSSGPPAPNREGLGHLAFSVHDVPETLAAVVAHGGTALGEVVRRTIPDVGLITFVYAADPEGNGLELQHWVRLRPVSEDDGPAVARMVGQVLSGFGLEMDSETDSDLKNPKASYDDAGGWFAVLDDDTDIVGSVGVFRLSDTTCELRKMYLLPSLQGLGLGRLLLEAALEKARLLGFHEMVLETNSCLESARRMYERYGFEACFPDHLSPRCDLAMRRAL
jgi:GNAT superfamily N-acetyltransferase/predicted enzyme related to lactoylglutathione lyase